MTDSVSNISLPDWLPDSVVLAVHSLLPSELPAPAEVKEPVLRLATDPRMKFVWRELTKQERVDHRRTGKPYHLGQLQDGMKRWGALADAMRKQAEVARALGHDEDALRYTRSAATYDQLEADEPAREIDPAIEHALSFGALFMRVIGLYGMGMSTVSHSDIVVFAERLRAEGRTDVAEAVRRYAEEASMQPYIFRRRRANPRVGAFVIALTGEMQTMFGAPHYRLVATMANILFIGYSALDKDKVRALVHRHKKRIN